jgi:hypothetical protein
MFWRQVIKSEVVAVHAVQAHGGEQRYSSNHSWPKRYVRVVNITPRPLYPREKTTVPSSQDAGRAPEPVKTFRKEKTLLSLSGIERRIV